MLTACVFLLRDALSASGDAPAPSAPLHPFGSRGGTGRVLQVPGGASALQIPWERPPELGFAPGRENWFCSSVPGDVGLILSLMLTRCMPLGKSLSTSDVSKRRGRIIYVSALSQLHWARDFSLVPGTTGAWLWMGACNPAKCWHRLPVLFPCGPDIPIPRGCVL